MAHANSTLGTTGCKHTYGICNTYAFSLLQWLHEPPQCYVIRTPGCLVVVLFCRKKRLLPFFSFAFGSLLSFYYQTRLNCDDIQSVCVCVCARLCVCPELTFRQTEGISCYVMYTSCVNDSSDTWHRIPKCIAKIITFVNKFLMYNLKQRRGFAADYFLKIMNLLLYKTFISLLPRLFLDQRVWHFSHWPTDFRLKFQVLFSLYTDVKLHMCESFSAA
jgi:hypothetical protein